MITKRLTAERRLVSHYDQAFVEGFTQEQREEYTSTMDISKLGDMNGLKVKPTIFKVSPLLSKYEYMTYSDPPDAWGIFSHHVKEVEYCDDIDFKWTNGVMDSKHQEDLQPALIQNIASMIMALANMTSSDAFFLPSVGSLRFAQAVLRRRATKSMVIPAPSEAVKPKRSRQKKSR